MKKAGIKEWIILIIFCLALLGAGFLGGNYYIAKKNEIKHTSYRLIIRGEGKMLEGVPFCKVTKHYGLWVAQEIPINPPYCVVPE